MKVEILDDLKEKFKRLESALKVNFKNKDLLVQAFVHRSFLNENPEFPIYHNERLEFLGDAILEHIVTEYLYLKYPEKTEGELTSWRAALVNSKILAEVAKKAGFNSYLLLSQGEIKEEGKARQYILANTFESYVGSLYLDQGLDECTVFIMEYLMKELPRIIKQELFKDAKSKFQEESQDKVGVTPIYSVMEQWGPDHEKTFVVGVFLQKELVAKGEGSSKQEAEEKAAEKALKVKKW
jgi:ribonuclease III